MPEVEDANDYEAMPIMCCVCRKIKTADDAWIEPEKIIPEAVHVSHGFCPDCAVEEWAKIFARRIFHC